MVSWYALTAANGTNPILSFCIIREYFSSTLLGSMSWFNIKPVWLTFICQTNQLRWSSPCTPLHLPGGGAPRQHDVSKKLRTDSDRPGAPALCRPAPAGNVVAIRCSVGRSCSCSLLSAGQHLLLLLGLPLFTPEPSCWGCCGYCCDRRLRCCCCLAAAGSGSGPCLASACLVVCLWLNPHCTSSPNLV